MTANNLKVQFDYIRLLIREKRYEEARTALHKIQHPTAQVWLTKLDEIDPPFSFPETISTARSYIPSPVVVEEPKKQKKEGISCKRIMGNVLLALLFLVIWGIFFSGNSGSNNTIAPSMQGPPATPVTRTILDTMNTGFPRPFLDRISESVRAEGNVEYFLVGVSNQRLLIDIEVQLLSPRNGVSNGISVIENVFREYANTVNEEYAGYISLIVAWYLNNGTRCGISAGMGYTTMQNINWSNNWVIISQRLNHERYPDNSSTGNVAWYSNVPSGLPACRS